MADDGLIDGLLNMLERDLLPVIERGDLQAWGRANRIADAVLALLPERERSAVDLPAQNVGALQALYVAARGLRSDTAAKTCALYTLVTRGREAVARHRGIKSATVRPPTHKGILETQWKLPAWVPESCILGGFRLVRPMAIGGLGSLFLARRLEDENDPYAREVVLKVPHDPNTMLPHVSEADMFAQFRAEAAALSTLPAHPNLARIEAFDVSARPKPYLVMELVDGPTLERELLDGNMTTARAFEILDGVLAGLDAMHSAGIGHLDLKPDNVVLRDGERATLVDFGLSGRAVRKRCGSPTYAAPEIWNDDRAPSSPFAADAYSFACLAFETLTRRRLCDDPDIFTTIRMHMMHDGLPNALTELRQRPELGKLVEVLSRALRANPAQRTRIRTMRTDLARVGGALREMAWPLSGARMSATAIVGAMGQRRLVDAGFPPESLEATLMARSA